VVIPLFWEDMVILPLFFQLYDFTPTFSNWRENLTLFREEHFNSVKLLWKVKFAHMNLTVLCDFTPMLTTKMLQKELCEPKSTKILDFWKLSKMLQIWSKYWAKTEQNMYEDRTHVERYIQVLELEK
jgi:hypothetical protein